MTTPTVQPFDLETPYGVCTVRDNRVSSNSETFAMVTFLDTLKVNGKSYGGNVMFYLSPAHRGAQGNGVYYASTGHYANDGLTAKGRDKVAEFLTSEPILKKFLDLGMFGDVDPYEVRTNERDRLWARVTRKLYEAEDEGIASLPKEGRREAMELREELMSEIIIHMASRLIDGEPWHDVQNGKFGNE